MTTTCVLFNVFTMGLYRMGYLSRCIFLLWIWSAPKFAQGQLAFGPCELKRGLPKCICKYIFSGFLFDWLDRFGIKRPCNEKNTPPTPAQAPTLAWWSGYEADFKEANSFALENTGGKVIKYYGAFCVNSPTRASLKAQCWGPGCSQTVILIDSGSGVILTCPSEYSHIELDGYSQGFCSCEASTCRIPITISNLEYANRLCVVGGDTLSPTCALGRQGVVTCECSISVAVADKEAPNSAC